MECLFDDNEDGVLGQCLWEFWYQLTSVVLDKELLNGFCEVGN